MYIRCQYSKHHTLLRAREKLASVRSVKTTKENPSVESLFPLCAIGVIVILCIAIIASYVRTANMESTVILPGGVTYTGK